ncbi:MAG: hypothetical protein Q9160_008077 [Pyrenula sp. 1 TL-2023]
MSFRYVLLSLLTFLTVTLFYSFPFHWNDGSNVLSFPQSKKTQVPSNSRKNIWSDLTDDEAVDVVEYLHSHSAGLNLTRPSLASSRDNAILIIETLRPNKTDALQFLDMSGNRPGRYARATIDHGASDPAEIREYMVGPLPISPKSKIEPLKFLYNSGRSATPHSDSNPEGLVIWLKRIGSDIEDITLDLLDCKLALLFHQPGDVKPDNGECIVNPVSPGQEEIERNAQWIGFSRLTNAWSLLPQGLYIKIDTTGRDPAGWKLLQVFYNSQLYEDIHAFRKAWKSPEFERLPPNADGNWTSLRPGPQNDENCHDAPYVVQPGKSRVLVDRSESFVSWLGFEFNLAFSQVTGLSLFDVRIDGERLVYELGMQEALAEYAGSDPKMSGTAFTDTSYGFGALATELVPGYDCPEYADFLDTQHSHGETVFKHRGTICVFETPLDYPIQRHSALDHTTTFANSALIVRSISTIGNYDYTTDYIFYLDGSIEIKLRASGYIQGAYGRKNAEYGYLIHDFVSSAVHDHVLNFKADLDVAGSSNVFEAISLREKEVEYPWAPDTKRRTMTLEKSVLPDESQASLNWAANAASVYVVGNRGAQNAYGENRAYRVMPGSGIGSPVHLTTRKSSTLRNIASWAEYDLHVTKQKDTEPRSSSPLNFLTPNEPLVQFDQFLDGESLIDEDLVLWFNLGTHHLPTTADIPVTLMTTSASSVIITPFNYFDNDRSRKFAAGKTIQHDVPDAGSGGVGGNDQQMLQQYRKMHRLIPQAWPWRYGT